MKRLFSLISLLMAVVLAAGCSQPLPEAPETTQPTQATLPAYVDHTASLALNMSSNTAKQSVTVKAFIDGDTVHFHVPESVNPTGVLKARFLAINTPESTGKIEEYGKAASRFTREKLSAATSILVESDDSNWNPDSTGDRYLVWVWYRTDESQPYRNLNLEILQEGLAIANSSNNNRYGSMCMAAIRQAKAYKLGVYSGQKDPEFFYGEAVELTLRELRTNIESYNGVKVAFNGVITMNDGGSVYVEDYDEESGIYYGISVYYGYGLPGTGLDILSVGNETRIVGTVQFYELGGTYQVSGLSYRQMKPDDPNNIQLISQGHSPAYVLTEAETFVNGTVELMMEDSLQTFPYAQLVLGTSIEMRGLEVVSVDTTDNPTSDSNGAMTLTCRSGELTVTVRTAVLRDAEGNLITADAYLGKTIDVKGLVDFFADGYQIKVLSAKGITVTQ